MKTRNWNRILGAACVAALLWSAAASAANAPDPAGTVQFVMGEVWAESGDGDRRLLAKGDEIFQSDRIESGERASAQLMMVDRARIAVRPQSVFVVAEYRYRGGDGDGGGENSSVLKDQRQAIRFATERRTEDQSWRAHANPRFLSGTRLRVQARPHLRAGAHGR